MTTKTTNNKNVYFGLRSKQKESFDACLDKKVGIITDTCGTGKSHIEFELICNSINKCEKIIVLAAHRLDLIDQHLVGFKKYVEEFHPEINDDSYTQLEISSANRAERGVINTTRVPEIKNNIISTTKPLLITICYNSMSRLYDSFIGSTLKVDLMICDEGHWGMSGVEDKKEEKRNQIVTVNNSTRKMPRAINKYEFIKFCDKFLIFTATPFKQTMVGVDNYNMEVIHDYSYAEATSDNTVLPFCANFYGSETFGDRATLGMVEHAFNDLRVKFKKTSSKLLVCGTSLEINQKLFGSLYKKYKKQIDAGTLAIAKIGSSTTTADNELIPSCEFISKDSNDYIYNTFGNSSIRKNGHKLSMHDDRLNKAKCLKAMHDWINSCEFEPDLRKNGKSVVDSNGNPIHRDIIIIHCQMLGVGVDVPNINGVCILGNKFYADLYQSIMRPCRIAYFDRNVSVENRLEDHFEVYIYTEDDVKKEIKKFVNQLADIGGIELINASILGSVAGTTKEKLIPTAEAKELYSKCMTSLKVKKECSVIFDNKNIEENYKDVMELIKKYPDAKEYIENKFYETHRG